MKTKLVPSAWIEKEGRRLDCGPYLSGAIETKLLMEKLPVPKARLHELTLNGKEGIFHAGRESRTWVEDPAYGVPFLSSSEVLLSDLSRVPLISRKQVTATPKFILHQDWTLITRSGTIGRMVYCRSDMDGFACSEHVLRVVPDKSKVLPGYLYAFLASRYGVPMVVGGTYGAIIQHIEPEHVWNLPVPIAPESIQQRTNRLICQAAQLRSDASASLAKTVTDLEESVGLPRLSAHQGVKVPDISMVSSTAIGGRMDSMFHSNYHASALGPLNALPSASRTTVGGLAESVVEPGRFRRVPIEDGPLAVPFLGNSGNVVGQCCQSAP